MKNNANRLSKSVRSTQRYRLLFLRPVLIDVILVFIYPLSNSIRMGLQHYTIASVVNGAAPYIGLKNYAEIFAKPLQRGLLAGSRLVFKAKPLQHEQAVGTGNP